MNDWLQLQGLDSSGFDLNLWLAGLFALAVLISLIGIWRHARLWRAALLWLQLPCAALLLGTLLLRDGDVDVSVEGSIIVLGADADTPSAALLESGLPVVALPSAPAIFHDVQNIEHVADLATALRRYPEVTHLHLIGDRLGPADREAMESRDFSMQTPAVTDASAAIIELDLPSDVAAGTHWQLRGRVRGEVEQLRLLDPAQREVDTAVPDEGGHFSLRGLARAAGPSLYTVQVRSGDVVQQSLRVPINATTAAPLRALLLAAVPTAETKYLRRWATDAGVQLESRITLAPTLSHGNAPRISAAMFSELDLLIADERSWSTLRPLQDELRSAIEEGLGLLLRVTGPVPDGVLADWQALGLDLQTVNAPPRLLRLSDAAKDAESEPLHAWPMSVDPLHSVPIWRDSTDEPLSARQPLRQGRIGAVWLSDSFVLYTRGERERHAGLWSVLFADLAKARAEPAPQLPERAQVGRRAVLCSSSERQRVQTPAAELISLISVDEKNSSKRCAAFWPRSSGWHKLLASTDDNESTKAADSPFYVFSADGIASLSAEGDRRATTALVNRSEPPKADSTDREIWRRYALLIWLLLIAMIWWMERRAQSAPADVDRAKQ